MLTQENAVEIRILARQGKSIRAIARELGTSRNTVRRYLRDREVPRYGPRAVRPTKLDPFKRYLASSSSPVFSVRQRACEPRGDQPRGPQACCGIAVVPV